MKHLNTLFILLILFTLSFSAATQSSEPIEMTGGGWSGLTFTQAGVLLDKTQLKEQLSVVPEAMQLYKSGKGNYTAVAVMSGLGGGLIGWNIADALREDRDTKWWLAGAGATLILLAIPVANGGTNKIRQALDVYNNSITQATPSRSLIEEMVILVQPDQVGLQLRF